MYETLESLIQRLIDSWDGDVRVPELADEIYGSDWLQRLRDVSWSNGFDEGESTAENNRYDYADDEWERGYASGYEAGLEERD